ncbi:nucleotidase [Virgibacillus soli]|uniref:5' nucleotidase, NT5C type n=1 Tax=Lederbergia galactosidilytica TaxID=217031 RepID=UPI00071606F5|nr:hypothetical protein [Lederbergia galactosidilytica]KRG15575.1 nucleotidase [Virgibacillus soli]MBP1914793.1 putative HAD superfamily protein [Lederbergia galactosidilytica]
MKKRFGIDIDGTVTCPTSFIPHINKKFQLNITLDDLTEYEITDCLDLPEKDVYEWFMQSEAKLYKEAPLATGAKTILNTWFHDHELYFISARHHRAMEITESYFLNHAIDFHHIELIGSHDKVGTAKKYSVDLFFEDKHDNAVAISEELNIPVILFDTPYNRKAIPDKVIRVQNWQEAKNWVDQWLALDKESKYQSSF